MSLDPDKHHQERHTGNLATPEERELFVQHVATTMEKAAKALLDVAERLRTDPEGMLVHAFQPSVVGMVPSTTARLEISWHAEPQVKKPFMDVTGKTIVARHNEIGIRAIWQEGVVKPVEDLHRF